MSSFIHVHCPCGSEVRAKSEQIGSAVRCWKCGRDVPVPLRTRPLLSSGFGWALRDTFRGGVVVPVVGWAVAAVAALFVPVVGPWLAFALLAVGAWFYQSAAADAGESGFRPRSVTGLEPADESEPDGPVRLARRALLSVVAAAALVAPVLIRHGGRLRAEDGGGSLVGMLAALSGWAVVPLLLAAVNARDRRRPISTWAAAGALFRHPVATSAALLVFPLGLVAVEALVVLLTLEQGVYILTLCDVMPTPRVDIVPSNKATITDLVFRFDRTTARCPYFPEHVESFPVYSVALAHGYWFSTTLPPSLTRDWERPRFDPSFHGQSTVSVVAISAALSTLILGGVGLALGVQARWLGVVAALDAAALPSDVPASDAPPIVSGNGAAPPAATPAFAPSAPPYAAIPPLFAPTSPAFATGTPVYAPSAPVFLPAAPPAPLAVLPPPHAAAVAPEVAAALTGPPGAPKVLIIDDERAFAHAIGKILVGRGFTVLLAADAAEGHRLAVSARPDLIVLDLLLPDKHGMDLCRELRADPRVGGVPIIVATFRTGADDEIAGLTNGADDYLAKPYVVDVLVARIRKQLHRARA